MKNRCILYAILSLSLVVSIEIIFRIIGFGDPPLVLLDSKVEYYLKPKQRYSRFGNQISSNSYGMRAEEITLANIDMHVYIFGDSIVYGNHFLDQEEIVGYQLDALSHPLENNVYSVAASSWGPQNILAYINKFGPFKGKVAILIQSSHDRQDVPFESDNIVPYRTKTSLTAIGDFSQALFQRYVPKTSRKDKIGLTLGERRARSSRSLEELVGVLKEHFKHVLLVHHATRLESANANVEASRYYALMAKKMSIDFLSTVPLYKKCKHNNIYRDDIHLNNHGSQCLSQLIHKQIENL